MSVIKIAGIAVCIAASLSLISCTNSRQVASKSSTASTPYCAPVFLENISLEGGQNSIETASSLGPKKRSNEEAIGLQQKYAELLNVPVKEVSNFALYSFIEDWYGVRYCFGGNDKSGIDCSAFVMRLYEQVFKTDVLRTAFDQFSSCSLIKDINSLKEGDLVFFRTRGKRISHVGVYLKNKRFVHASSSQGVMISSLDEKYWRKYYAGAGYIPKS